MVSGEALELARNGIIRYFWEFDLELMGNKLLGESKIEVAKKLLILKDEVASQNILGGNSPGIWMEKGLCILLGLNKTGVKFLGGKRYWK